MKHPRSLALLVLAAFTLGCAGVKQNPVKTGSGGGSGAGTGTGGGSGSTGSGGSINPPPSSCNGTCDDFGGGPFGPDGTSGSVPSGAIHTKRVTLSGLSSTPSRSTTHP